MRVAVRELKAHLSRLLLRAQQGEVIEVTSHNKPIACIVGISPHVGEGQLGLIPSGTLSWNGGKPRLSSPLSLTAGGRYLSQIVLDDRR